MTGRRLGRERPLNSLAGVTAKPAYVFVGGRVVSPNQTTSPLTGTRAAAFFWRFVSQTSSLPPWSSRFRSGGRWTEVATAILKTLLMSDPTWDPGPLMQEIERGMFGPDLVIRTETGSVLVRCDGLEVVGPATLPGVVTVDRRVPGFARVSEAAKYGPVSVQETALGTGNPVSLRGYVKRPDLGSGAYRSAHPKPPDLVTCPECGPVLLYDLTLNEP